MFLSHLVLFARRADKKVLPHSHNMDKGTSLVPEAIVILERWGF